MKLEIKDAMELRILETALHNFRSSCLRNTVILFNESKDVDIKALGLDKFAVQTDKEYCSAMKDEYRRQLEHLNKSRRLLLRVERLMKEV